MQIRLGFFVSSSGVLCTFVCHTHTHARTHTYVRRLLHSRERRRRKQAEKHDYYCNGHEAQSPKARVPPRTRERATATADPPSLAPHVCVCMYLIFFVYFDVSSRTAHPNSPFLSPTQLFPLDQRRFLSRPSLSFTPRWPKRPGRTRALPGWASWRCRRTGARPRCLERVSPARSGGSRCAMRTDRTGPDRTTEQAFVVRDWFCAGLLRSFFFSLLCWCWCLVDVFGLFAGDCSRVLTGIFARGQPALTVWVSLRIRLCLK